jgi:hypothetical protein
MAVIEYMLHKDGPRRQVPDFVGDRGHWFNPADNTYIGWVDDNRDYYVPESVESLTKSQFVTRQLAMHTTSPFTRPADGASGPDAERVEMTTEEVTAQAEGWYDDFVAKNSGE